MTIYFLCILLISLSLMMSVRNTLVYKYQVRALNTIYAYQVHMIDTDIERHTNRVWNLLDSPSYPAMLFMITCWTYESFYGNLEQKMKEITNAQN